MQQKKPTTVQLVYHTQGREQTYQRQQEERNNGILIHKGKRLILDMDGNLEYPTNLCPKIIGIDEFPHNHLIVSVKIPNSVKEILAIAFVACVNLAKIDFGSSLEKIGNKAFYETKLAKVIFPKSILLIEEDAFASMLETVIFEESERTVTIKKKAFNTTTIQKLVLPVHCNISHNAFDKSLLAVISNTSLKTGSPVDKAASYVHFLDNLCINPFTKLNFQEFQNLRIICIPSFVEVIPQKAFKGLKYLEEVKFSRDSKLSKIESKAFKKCINIKVVHLPKSLREIQDKAFYDCTCLNIVWFEDIDSLPCFGEKVFYGCDLMNTQIDIDRTVSKRIPLVFSTSKSSQIVHFLTDVSIPSLSKKNFKNKALIHDDAIEVIDDIDDETFTKLALFFKKNPNLKIEQQNVDAKSITSTTFQSCDVLINIKKDSKRFLIRRGIEVIAKLAFLSCYGLTKIRIPDSVKVIGTSAFNRCFNLKKVIISKNVKIIPNCCFLECRKLRYVVFAEKSILQKIERWAFQFTRIIKMILPSYDVEIAENSFSCKFEKLVKNEKLIINIDPKILKTCFYKPKPTYIYTGS